MKFIFRYIFRILMFLVFFTHYFYRIKTEFRSIIRIYDTKHLMRTIDANEISIVKINGSVYS